MEEMMIVIITMWASIIACIIALIDLVLWSYMAFILKKIRVWVNVLDTFVQNFKKNEDKLKNAGFSEESTMETALVDMVIAVKPFLDEIKKSDMKPEDIRKITKAMKKFAESMDEKVDIDAELSKVDAKMKKRSRK